ncbi:acyltransferase family protein [Longispora sp. NPDC051575]|uniref:acyltransferase family protein n=1 Tax=Longispora sp. NPDC051575 TaxID=3154943 RepID=UPI003436C708
MRSGYFDLLRAAALTRVVLYHSMGWAWLTVAFPAMGMMFALAGALTAASLDRAPTGAVLGRRLRRLLPPVWALAAVGVPVMLFGGESAWSLLWWLLPLRDPHVAGVLAPALSMIWYIRVYLWFLLLSPVLLRVLRRYPVPTLLTPFALLLAFSAIGARGGSVPSELWDLALYGTCWLLGFAHHDGLLRAVPRKAFLALAGTLAAAGLGWIATHPGPRGFDLNDIPVGNALWSAAVVLLMFRLAPRADPLRDRPRLAGVVGFLNRRAMTVYLWHQMAILGTLSLATAVGVTLDRGEVLAMVLALLAGAVVVFGWVEDVAARRPVRLPALATR